MKVADILHKIVVVGVFSLLLTPLIVTDSLFFPFITGKAFFFRIIVEIVIAFWILSTLLDRRFRPRSSWLFWSVVASALVLILASVFSENPFRSLWSNFERMEGLIGYLHLLAYFLILVSALKTDRVWKWYFRASLIVSAFVGIYGLLQLAGKAVINQGGVRLDATFGNATYLAVYMLIHVGLAVWLWWEDRGRRWVGLPYGALILIHLVVLYNTATRGSILGLVGGVILASILLAIGQKGSGRVRKMAIGFLLLTLMVVGTFFLAKDSKVVQSSPVLSRFASISVADVTTESRITIWNMALAGFRDRPLLGWGPENFYLVFSKYYEPHLWGQEPWFDHAHNIFLDWLVNAGVVGLAVYLSLYASALYLLWRGRSDYFTKSIFTGLLAAYAFHNMFVFDNLVSAMLFFSLLAFVHFRSVESIAESKIVTSATHRYTISAAVIVALVLAVYHINVKPLQAARYTLIGVHPNSPPDAKLTVFKDTFALNTFGTNEALEQLFAQARTTELHQLAVQEGERFLERFPEDPRANFIFGTFLSRTGKLDQAAIYLERAHQLSPKKQITSFSLISNLLSQGNVDAAVTLARETYELAPEFPEARVIYALALIHDRQFALAEEVVGDMKLDDRFINVYAAVGNYAKVLELWQKKVEADPNNAEFRFKLAASFLMTGQRNQAIAQLEEAIKIEPKVEKQARQLIAEIRAGRNPLDGN